MTARAVFPRRTFLKGSACAAACLPALAAGERGSRQSENRSRQLPTATTRNLVPAHGGPALGYWCTWQAQLDSAEKAGSPVDHLTQNATRALDEHDLFGDPGWIRYFASVRPDLLFLADLGWDVPADATFTESELGPLGSYVLDTRKFPSCTGTPVERLRALVDRVRANHWGGLGLWLPAQAFGEDLAGRMLPPDKLSSVMRAAVHLFRDAGVSYLKFDYGVRGDSVAFRRLVSDIVAAEAPNLIVEHASPCGPLNDVATGPDDKTIVHKTGRYRPWADGAILRRAVQLLEFSDILRTYDVLDLFAVSTRLDRAADILSGARGLRRSAVLNTEDGLYLAAALGCAVGILRHPNPKDSRPKVREVLRAVRWQRIAPPFPAHIGRLEVDERILTDSFTYTAQTAEFWIPSIVGQSITQAAPARIARGMGLPEVVARHEPPFVAASRHPNGAVALAALPRTAPEIGSYMPLADVALQIDGDSPVGLFGRYRSINLQLGRPLRGRRVLAQDLATDHSHDVTPLVSRDGASLNVPGELIDELSAFGAPNEDHSEPGIVLTIV